MDLREISSQIETKLSELFSEELTSGLAAREDSRAFGAMVEQKIADNWKQICLNLGHVPLERPGRRTLYDVAFQSEGKIVGIDVKTKNLDPTSYSDGGICSVDNVLKFLANDGGIFLIAELGHNKLSGQSGKRSIIYIRVVPFIFLPFNMYRIENLGTGQVRFNYTIDEIWDEIDWSRGIADFYNMFIDCANERYRRVSRDALNRIASLEAFRRNGYKNFSFNRN